jgi:DNA modification methylase
VDTKGTQLNKVYWGDCRTSLKEMAAAGVQVQSCITSPPYYGLRDYGTATYEGGDANCDHTISGWSDNLKPDCDRPERDGSKRKSCIKCGAKRVDQQIGLEETPQEFIDNLVEVFACVWDVLKDDGTLWVNLGDSYYNYRPGKGQALSKQTVSNTNQDLPQTCARRGNKLEGYKEKDLMGMPWRLAFALQDFGWYLRQDIIWHKPNPMPESVQDRCTKAHEYIFLLTKKSHYYFDNKAIKEPVKEDWGIRDRTNGKYHKEGSGLTPHSGLEKSYEMANKRSVWTVNTKPYKGAHFAVYPEELIEPCVLASTKVGDVILDPFFGSGTTGQVAQNLGRKWIGCELNPDYEDLQNERVKQQGLELL